MQWQDDAIVLGGRRQGEANVVLEVMTRERGRCLGLVRGGRSARHAAELQPGNGIGVTWRARLDEHLGTFAVEPAKSRAADLMASSIGLNAVQTLAAHLRLLAERDPHPALFTALETVLDHGVSPIETGGLVIRFELMILEALGFGLDLAACALTEATSDLAYVSPRTGRAASRAAGEPWADRLLALPPFLTDERSHVPPAAEDIRAGFRLTGHFLAVNVWGPRGVEPPPTRDALVAALGR
ncbi:MAG: DNA repair protein RecO [Ancalomicrobiaceae bacterium]|nr:DNA repair protein RecO [Ancalomicrobiaceae bacterium]